MSEIGTADRPRRVAIVGSGPSGFYTATTLLGGDPEVQVDLIDRLPTPYGLVRGGVAPDHQKIKGVVRAFEKTAADPRFRFVGNVTVGAEPTIDDLLASYDQVVLAVGAESSRTLGIDGEDLPGSHAATAFVGWYNGHPDHQHHAFDLSGTTALVVGIGNVALDVARILAKPAAALAGTDISRDALAILAESTITDVHLLGRRGPAQAAFSPAEIREIDETDGIELVVHRDDATVDPLSAAWLEAHGDKISNQNVAWLASVAGRPLQGEARRIHLHLRSSPIRYLGTDRITAVEVGRNRLVDAGRPDGSLTAEDTGERRTIDADLVLRAVGYRGVPIPGVPFDDRRGTVPNAEGRVLATPGGPVVPRLYVVGWAKRGPTGKIGTNRADAKATVACMDADLPSLDPAPRPPRSYPGSVDWAAWEVLDQLEVATGQAQGKIREKFVRVDDMLAALVAK